MNTIAEIKDTKTMSSFNKQGRKILKKKKQTLVKKDLSTLNKRGRINVANKKKVEIYINTLNKTIKIYNDNLDKKDIPNYSGMSKHIEALKTYYTNLENKSKLDKEVINDSKRIYDSMIHIIPQDLPEEEEEEEVIEILKEKDPMRRRIAVQKLSRFETVEEDIRGEIKESYNKQTIDARKQFIDEQINYFSNKLKRSEYTGDPEVEEKQKQLHKIADKLAKLRSDEVFFIELSYYYETMNDKNLTDQLNQEDLQGLVDKFNEILKQKLELLAEAIRAGETVTDEHRTEENKTMLHNLIKDDKIGFADTGNTISTAFGFASA